jgi:hypothetical protein
MDWQPEIGRDEPAKETKKARKKGFRGGGSDDGLPRPPWALLLLLMASILAVIFAAYAYAASRWEEHA